MKQTYTIDEIKAYARETVNKKIEQKSEILEREANRDLELLNEAIEMVQSKVVYKKVERKYGGYDYVLATEEMICADYMNPPKYDWKKGIMFYSENHSEYKYHGMFEINGESYYDMRYLLTSYAEDVREALKKAEGTVRILKEHLEKHKETLERLPKLKAMIMDWEQRNAKENDNA